MAVEVVGSQGELARQLGIKRQQVTKWVRRGYVPAARCVAIEAATGRRVTCEMLRPDIYVRSA
jgi:DNA-binding transcriptional regulator YdaS (Cro superfamily)